MAFYELMALFLYGGVFFWDSGGVAFLQVCLYPGPYLQL
jgi:hypothetical protein